ncbi:agamous-like MADS-box protein AGL62 [Solanum tuberosum]|uniref:agamous-like MADS-box protein AGL62 n=1 Tax=Solanum tuberosum TaxID=4113 RepID=UPI00073A458E|nr:PREDICTED: agamous-like MADS-box protein AGL62 [Solanum tuberosum]
MTRRISKGCQRVDMVKIKNARNLGVTFSKRRVVFSFGYPSVDTLVDRFLGRNLPPPNNDVHNQQIVDLRKASICELNTKLMNLEGVLQMEKNRGESLREIRKRADGVWWESPMEELNLFQLQHLKKALEILKKKVEKEAQMVNNNAFPFLGSAWTPPNCAS